MRMERAGLTLANLGPEIPRNIQQPPLDRKVLGISGLYRVWQGQGTGKLLTPIYNCEIDTPHPIYLFIKSLCSYL